MNTAPLFHAPLLGIQTSKVKPAFWDTALENYESKKYKDTILAVLNYIDDSIVKKMGNTDKTEFHIPHGPTTVTVKIKDGKYSVQAPFLVVLAKNRVSLLRQVHELNFSKLGLSQIVLRSDKLYFEFECPLELCDRNKVWSIFEEICSNSDYYDDIFIDKFGATRVEGRAVKNFPKEKRDIAWKKYHEYLDEGLKYFDYFEEKRQTGFAWDIFNITLKKIDHFMAPQGFLGSEIREHITSMYQKELPLNDVVNKTKMEILKLKGIARDKFDQSLYFEEVFVSQKYKANLTYIQNGLRKPYDDATTEISHAEYASATLNILYNIYSIYYNNEVPAPLAKIFNKALKNVSGKPWKESAQILWQTIDSVMSSTETSLAARSSIFAAPLGAFQDQKTRKLLIIYAVVFGFLTILKIIQESLR